MTEEFPSPNYRDLVDFLLFKEEKVNERNA